MDEEDTTISNETIRDGSGSRADWEHLDEWVRGKVQDFIQEALEEGGTEFLGRRTSEKRKVVDGKSGYCNGYGKPRRLRQ